MSFWFTVKEGLQGFRRARLASIITVTSIGFTLLLIGFFLLFSYNLNNWIGHERARLELEVFFEPDLTDAQGQALTARIKSLEGVAQAKYVSKEEAARRFEKEFGQNIYEVLETNPLPPSCTVKIKSGYRSATSVRKISSQIQKLDGVSDVVYEKDILALIDHYIIIVYLIAAAIGLLLAIISMVLLYNTVRLTIHARRDIIEIMELVGATAGFIRRPFVIEGFLHGLMGALLADAFIYLAVELVKKTIYPYVAMRSEIYIFLVVFGALIGLISSKLSVSKHLAELK